MFSQEIRRNHTQERPLKEGSVALVVYYRPRFIIERRFKKRGSTSAQFVEVCVCVTGESRQPYSYQPK